MGSIPVDLHTLPSLPLDQRNTLPDTAGVYFVISPDDTVLYIGQTTSLHQRWANHHRIVDIPMYNHCRIAWLSIENTSTLKSTERACIAHFNPTLNIAMPAQLRNVIYLRLPAALHAYVERQARAHGVSVNAELVDIIENDKGRMEDDPAFVDKYRAVLEPALRQMMADAVAADERGGRDTP